MKSEAIYIWTTNILELSNEHALKKLMHTCKFTKFCEARVPLSH